MFRFFHYPERCDLFSTRRYVGGWLDTVLKWSYEVITARNYCDHVTRTGIYVTLRDMTRSHVTIVTTINLCVSISGQVSSYMCELLASMNAFEVWSYMMTPAPMKEYRICIFTILYNFWPEGRRDLNIAQDAYLCRRNNPVLCSVLMLPEIRGVLKNIFYEFVSYIQNTIRH